MKKILFGLIIILVSCNKEEKQMKTRTITTYQTVYKSGEYVKSDIKSKYSIGFYLNGSQEFFIGLIGYGENKDTTKFEIEEPITFKEEGNKKFWYKGSEFLFVDVFIRDTIFRYNNYDLESPNYYVICDSKERIIEEYEFTLRERKRYKNRKWNENGHLIYSIVEKEYVPNEFDKKIYTDIEISKKIVERREVLIQESEYTYY